MAERIMIILIESGIIYLLFFVSIVSSLACSLFLTMSSEQIEAVVSDTGNVSRAESSTPQLVFAITIWTYMTSHILVHIVLCALSFTHVR